MKDAKSKVNIIILDACRDYPLSWKQENKGDMMPPDVSLVKHIADSFIAYAAPGGVAKSGYGKRNSPYVKHLIFWIQQPNLSLDEIFTNVGRAVKNETFKVQRPGVYKEFYDNFYFVKTKTQSHGTVFQDSLKNGSLAPKMVWIKAGSFQMGSENGDFGF